MPGSESKAESRIAITSSLPRYEVKISGINEFLTKQGHCEKLNCCIRRIKKHHKPLAIASKSEQTPAVANISGIAFRTLLLRAVHIICFN